MAINFFSKRILKFLGISFFIPLVLFELNIINKQIGILNNLPKIFSATRYHSLVIDRKSLSKDLKITSSTSDGTIMGVMHKKYKIHGVQFHPESINTKYGLKILENFVKE